MRWLGVSLALFSAMPVLGIPVALDNADAFRPTEISGVEYRNKTCGLLCRENCLANDCPLNVGSFESRVLELLANGTATGRDARLTAVVSNIGSPSVSIGWCGFEAKCFVPMADVEHSGNFWVNALQNMFNQRNAQPGQPFERNLDMLKYSVDAAADIASYRVVALGLQLEELMEFTDINGDNKYSPDIDTVHQRVHFNSMAWKPMTYDERLSPGVSDPNVTLYSFNLTSADNKVSLRFETASYVDTPMPNPEHSELSRPQIRTPSAVRVVVHVANFTFQGGQTSRLALKTFLTTPNPHAAFVDLVGRRVLVVNRQTRATLGYLDFTPMALTTPGAGPSANEDTAERVKPSPLHDVLDMRELGYSLVRSLDSLSPDADERAIYFSYSGNAFRPSSVLWDLSIGHGPAPERTKSVFWAGAVLMSVLVCSAIVIMINRKVLMESLGRAMEEARSVKKAERLTGRADAFA